MTAGTSVQAAGLGEAYRAFERCDGAVDAAWIRQAVTCTGEELDALTDGQRYVLASTDSRDGSERVRIGRVDGIFSPAEVARMQEVLTAAIAAEFVAGMVESAQRTGKVEMGDPLAAGSAHGDCSILGEDIVFLRFTGGTEPFYLLQHNFAVEALYFPLRACLVHINDCLVPKLKLRRLFVQVLRGAKECASYMRSARRWGGLFVANESPFHYFYFQLPGTVIACFDRRIPLPATHTLARGFFADVPAMFALGSPTVVHDDGSALQATLYDDSVFVFGTGIRPRIWASPQRYRMIDDVVLQYCRRARAREVAAIRDSHDFVLWAGISSGKRCWGEEIDAVVGLATELARRFPRVALLLDGWTSTLTRQDMPPGYAEDASAFRRVSAAIPANVTCVDLVGGNPEEKIAFADLADFFVSSHGTASLYVSRVARRPGVTHISNVARDAAVQQHVHGNVTIVPREMVHDLECTGGDKFRVGYRIDPSEFVRFALSVLEAG